MRSPTEECDDGNLTPSDGCSDDCLIDVGYECLTPGELCTPICGDGRVVTGKEDCDDGPLEDSSRGVTGCNEDCSSGAATGWECTEGDINTASICSLLCPNGFVNEELEECDDENSENKDGCSSCSIDKGYECEGNPSVCTPICGDGLVVERIEFCDDGEDTPGCNDECTD